MNKKSTLYFLFFFTFLVQGCVVSFIDPHENYLQLRKSYIGKSIEKVIPQFAEVNRNLISITELDNGNIEYKFFEGRTCRTVFEVNPRTQIIVDFRFEGNKEDCFINP